MIRSRFAISAGSVALVAALATACGSVAAPSGAGFAGYRWKVVQIGGPHRDVPVPAHSAVPVFVAFTASGRLEAADGESRFHLRYMPVAGGYRATGYRGSFGWYASKAEERVAGAVGSVLRGAVHASVEQHRLHLSAYRYELVCVRVGAA